MENSKSLLPYVVSVVLLFVTTILIIVLMPLFEGIVVNRVTLEDETKMFIYSEHNLSLLRVFTFMMIGLSIAINGLNVLAIVNEKLKKTATLMMVIGGVLLFVYFISMLFIFPVKVEDLNIDRFNHYGWSLSLAGSIIMLSLSLGWVFGLLSSNQQQTLSIQLISEGAISVGLAIVLSVISDLIPGLKMPNGGSFSLSMLPLFVFALRRGIVSGSLVGLTYGVMNFLVDGLIIHWGSIFFDYLIPFTLLCAIAGIFMKKANDGIIGFSLLAVLLGGLARYIFHGISGVIFFAEWAPENMNVFYYSFVWYNLPYMAVSTAGTLVFVFLLHKRLITQATRIV